MNEHAEFGCPGWLVLVPSVHLPNTIGVYRCAECDEYENDEEAFSAALVWMADKLSEERKVDHTVIGRLLKWARVQMSWKALGTLVRCDGEFEETELLLDVDKGPMGVLELSVSMGGERPWRTSADLLQHELAELYRWGLLKSMDADLEEHLDSNTQ